MVFAHSPSYADAAPYLWSLVLSFALVILSIAPLYVARFKAQFEMSDLSSLRSMFDRYPAWGKRASWAQQNSFESFTLHAPATLLAIFSVMNGLILPPLTVVVAIAHPIFRVVYLVAYIGNIPPLRSVCWLFGLICSGILYGVCLSAMT
jgi:uncharacterized MAPEG superfamily protein